MSKNINKLVAIAIGISIMSGSVTTVFAADSTANNNATTNNTVAANTTVTTNAAQNTNKVGTSVKAKVKPVLTLKQAIDAAVDNSEKLALKSKEIKLYKDKLDVQEQIDEVQDDDNDFPYDKLKLLVKQNEEQKKYMKDQIEQDITDKYNNIVAKEKELNNMKKEIEIKTKELKDTDLKQKLGLITSIDMKNAEIKIQTLKNNQKAKEAQLKNSIDYFKVITEKDLNNYTLDDSIEFEAFKIDGSIDEYFDKVIDKYVKYDKKILDLTKDDLKDNKVDKPDDDAPEKSDYEDELNEDGSVKIKASDKYKEAAGKYATKWTDYGKYLTDKYTFASSTVSLEEQKRALKSGLKESYANLLDLENKINVMKDSIAVDNKQLSNAKLKYDMGLITKTEYDKQVFNIDKENLEVTLRTNIENYNKLKNNIQKPWLLSSTSGTR